MKNFKRKLAGFLIFAMVLGIMAPGVVAQAAGEKPTVRLSEDYGGAVAELEHINEYTVRYAQYIGDAKTAIGESAGVTIKDNAWETLEKKKSDPDATIDLSWCNKKKDSTLVFEFTKTGEKPYYVTKGIKAQPKAIKVALVAATDASIKNGPSSVPEDYFVGDRNTGFLCFYDAEKKTAISPASIESNPAFSCYDGQVESYLKKYMAKGKTFSFVLKSVGFGSYYQDGEVVSDDNGIATWSSQPAKFSYKKQANAPKVSYDVSKHTVTIKKGQEYQVVVGDKEPDVWYKVDDYNMDNGKVSKNRLEDLVVEVSGKAITCLSDEDLFSGNVVIKVRTAASTKSPSKIARLPINVVATGTSVDFTVGSATTDSIQVAYTAVDTTKGVTITNTTGSAYEVAVAASADGITAKTKWVQLAKKGEKKATVKLATKNITDPVVYVREAGVKPKKGVTAQLSGYAKDFNLKSLDKPDPRVTELKIEGTAVSNKSITVATNGAVGKASFELAIATGGSVESDTEVTLKFTYADLKLTKATAISVSGTEKGKVLAVPSAKVATSTDNSYTGEVKVTIKKDATTGSKKLTFKVGKDDPGFEVTIDVKNK